jgi:hypothetical protein
MKSSILAHCLLLALLLVRATEARGTSILEEQFRSDARAIIRSSGSSSSEQELSRRVEGVVVRMKREQPDLLVDETSKEKSITYEQLDRLYAEVRKRFEGRRAGEVIDYYSELLERRQLSPPQMRIFFRILRFCSQPSPQDKRANKTPEPTPPSVMPRAAARVTPAGVVAHL